MEEDELFQVECICGKPLMGIVLDGVRSSIWCPACGSCFTKMEKH